MGLGFTIALTLLGMFREFIGSGSFFGIRVFPEDYGVTIFVLAPGAFFVLAFLIAIMNKIKSNMAKKGKDTSKFLNFEKIMLPLPKIIDNSLTSDSNGENSSRQICRTRV
jgi:hypothetical protein